MKDKDNKSLVQQALDCAGSGLPDHYRSMAHAVVVKYGSDSLEAVVAQLYRDRMHGDVGPTSLNYRSWLSYRRHDMDDNMAEAVEGACQLLLDRNDDTDSYARRAAGNLLARRVLVEDLSLRLFGGPAPVRLRRVYTDMLCILHDSSNWRATTTNQ